MTFERTGKGREDIEKRRARQRSDRYSLNRRRKYRAEATRRDLATIERLINGSTN